MLLAPRQRVERCTPGFAPRGPVPPGRTCGSLVPRQRVERCASGVGVQSLGSARRGACLLEPSARVALAFRAYRARVLLLDDDGIGSAWCFLVERIGLEPITSEVRAHSPRLRSSHENCVVPTEGIEPAASRKSAGCSTIELRGRESDRGWCRLPNEQIPTLCLSHRCGDAACGVLYPHPSGWRSSARWRLDNAYWWSRRESNSRPVVADHVSYRLTTTPECEDGATKEFFPCSTSELQIRK